MPPKQQPPPSSAAFNERRLDIGNLPPRELVALRDQLEQESRSLAQRAMALQQVAAQFGGSGRAIERLAEQEKGGAALSGFLRSCDGVGFEIRSWGGLDAASERGEEARKKKEKEKATLDVALMITVDSFLLSSSSRPSRPPQPPRPRPLL